jgi:hypothetical protein
MLDEELEKKKPRGDSVWTEGSGVPLPQEPEGVPPTKKKKKFASGGYVKAADGCVQRGKTRGKIV